MPNKEFLEHSPLYKKFAFDFDLSKGIPKPSINMLCSVCKSEQTFKLSDKSRYEWERERTRYVVSMGSYPGIAEGFANFEKTDFLEFIEYRCASCDDWSIHFLLLFSPTKKYVQKVGQYPPWSIQVTPNVQQILGDDVEIYKKGIICESQGYGIGAYAYYRRIIENIIDDLLDKISSLIGEHEKAKYADALLQTKSLHSAQEKIDLVKELLPSSLRPNGYNPLSLLHDSLSKGIHLEDDEQCLDYAEHIRTALVYLVDQVAREETTKATFTESMKKLLDKKTKRQGKAG